MNKKIILITLTLGAMIFFSRILFAADPLEVAPDMYTLKFENERIRVMEVTFQPGQSIPEHSHPDHFAYVTEAGKLQVTNADGTVTDADLKVGDIVWFDAVAHKATNVGTTVMRALITELKEPKSVVAE